MLNVLLTVVWLGVCTNTGCTNEEVVELWTDSIQYCEVLAEQIRDGDGAVYADCSYKVRF